jgi:hypothetical protein
LDQETHSSCLQVSGADLAAYVSKVTQSLLAGSPHENEGKLKERLVEMPSSPFERTVVMWGWYVTTITVHWRPEARLGPPLAVKHKIVLEDGDYGKVVPVPMPELAPVPAPAAAARGGARSRGGTGAPRPPSPDARQHCPSCAHRWSGMASKLCPKCLKPLPGSLKNLVDAAAAAKPAAARTDAPRPPSPYAASSRGAGRGGGTRGGARGAARGGR